VTGHEAALIFNKLKNVMTCSFCTDLAAARNENNSSALLLGVIILELPPIILTVTLMFVNGNLHFFIGVLNPFHKSPHYQIPYIILLFMKHHYRDNV
jgi:hypothetical protein